MMSCVGSWRRRGLCDGLQLLLPANGVRSIPPSHRHPRPLSRDVTSGDAGASVTQSQLKEAGQKAPVSLRPLDEVFRTGSVSVWKQLRLGSQAEIRPSETPKDFDLPRLLDPQSLTRECAQYEVNVLQVKVKSQDAFCLRGASRTSE